MKTALYQLPLSASVVPARFKRNPKARRYILRLSSNGIAEVTIPRGGTIEYAVQFARKHEPWIEKQLRKIPPSWGHGTEVFFRGMPLPIQLQETPSGLIAELGPLRIPVPARERLRGAIEAELWRLAEPELVRRTLDFAAALGLKVRSVSVRNQKTRWGSCSARRTISLNWRLIQTPELVSNYIIVHELMHLEEMNHSERFWASVEEVYPSCYEAESWLREHSRLLRR